MLQLVVLSSGSARLDRECSAVVIVGGGGGRVGQSLKNPDRPFFTTHPRGYRSRSLLEVFAPQHPAMRTPTLCPREHEGEGAVIVDPIAGDSSAERLLMMSGGIASLRVQPNEFLASLWCALCSVNRRHSLLAGSVRRSVCVRVWRCRRRQKLRVVDTSPVVMPQLGCRGRAMRRAAYWQRQKTDREQSMMKGLNG